MGSKLFCSFIYTGWCRAKHKPLFRGILHILMHMEALYCWNASRSCWFCKLLQWVSWPGRSEFLCCPNKSTKSWEKHHKLHSLSLSESFIVVGELLTETSDLGVLLRPSTTWNCFFGTGWDQMVTKSRGNFQVIKQCIQKLATCSSF